jgi:single-stranded DNA-binding protein
MSLLALSPVVFVGRLTKKPTIYQFPGMNHNPTVPNGPINAATTAAANAAKQKAKATSNIPAEVAGDIKLTKEQIEAMKKRAQKFKKH